MTRRAPLAAAVLQLIASAICIIIAGHAEAAPVWSIDNGTLTVIYNHRVAGKNGVEQWADHAAAASPEELASIHRVFIKEIDSIATVIPKRSFKNCVNLEHFESPAFINTVYEEAFKNCRSLKHFSMVSKAAAISIRSGAFESSGIEELSISRSSGDPPNVNIHGAESGFNGAFHDSSIKTINIYGSISRIGEGAFANTSGVKIFMHSHEPPTQDCPNAFAGASGAELHAYDDATETQQNNIRNKYTTGSVAIMFDIHTPPNKSSAWSSDGESHWKPCTVHPSARASLSPHSSGEYHRDAMRHWMICGICTAEWNIGEHDAPDFDKSAAEHWKTCASCGADFSRAAHSLGEWRSGAATHWRECECGYASDAGAHTGDGVCDVCGRIMDGHASEYSAEPIGSPAVGADGALAVEISSGTARLLSLLIDDVEVGPDEYSVEVFDGGVVVTVSRGMLDRLIAGDHVLTAVFSDGRASMSFSVIPSGQDPGRSSSPACSAGGSAAALALLGLCVSRARRSLMGRRA